MIKSQTHINDHRITLFYFFNHHCPIQDISDKNLAQLPLIKSQGKPLWEAHKYNLSKDLISPIHQLFHKQNKSITSWQFNKQNLRQLNQSQITLTLRNRSQQRLKQNQDSTAPIQLSLEQLLHHQFSSGFSITSLELKLHCNKQAPTLLQLNESVAALARFNKLQLKDNNSDYTLGQLIQLLHGETSSEKEKKENKAKRVYTHSYIQIKNQSLLEEQQSQDIINRLALHYTSDYQLKNTQGRVEIIQDYHNVSHAFALEGSSTLVQLQEDSPEILQDYKNKVIRPAQQPIHLLAFHLENAMQQYQQLTSYWINQPQKLKKDAKILSDIENQLRNFKLNFFYPIISRINSHNQMQQKLYHIKQLDTQFNHLGKNTEMINQLIKQQHQTRYCKLASFGIAAAGYLTSFSIIKEGIEALNEWQAFKQAAPHIAENLHHYTRSISLGESLITFFIIWFFARRHCKHSDHHSHSASHHALEALHKRHPLE